MAFFILYLASFFFKNIWRKAQDERCCGVSFVSSGLPSSSLSNVGNKGYIQVPISPPIFTPFFRYCYLLNDLTPELLGSKCSSYEKLRDYLHLRGREAYSQKRVRFLDSASLWNLYISYSASPNKFALQLPFLTFFPEKGMTSFCAWTFPKRHP